MAARGPLPGPSPVYNIRNGVRMCRRVTALWALTDTVPGGGYVALAGSHKGEVAAPRAFLAGRDLDWLEQRGVATEPQLKAGSLLLIVGSTIHGLRPGAKLNGEQRLVECKFVAGRYHSDSTRSLVPSPPLPWTAELTEEEQTVLGLRDLPSAVGGLDTEPELDDGDEMEELRRREQFMWDMCGYLVIKVRLVARVCAIICITSCRELGAVSYDGTDGGSERSLAFDLYCCTRVPQGVMGPAWLGAANDAVDAMEPSASPPGAGTSIESWNKQFPDDAEAVPSEEMLGIGGVRLGGEFTWPHPHCQPFRRMIADAQLVERLDWILGRRARLDDARGLLLSHPGTMGHSLHSGPMREHAYVSAGSPFVLGWADSVNVAWQLRDVPRGLGGFCAIPGSHKSYLSLPRERPTSIDLPQVAHVPMSAGDVLIFLAGQVTHGAFKWRQSVNRRCVLHNYVPNDHPLNGRNWSQFREPAKL